MLILRNKNFTLSLCAVLVCLITYCQPVISIATDFAGVHNFKDGQRFTAVGQTIIMHFHVTPKDGAYAWYGYSAGGKFKNNFEAIAKSPSTIPASLDFKAYSQINLHSLSIGWKHYLVGAYNSGESWSLYFTAGFGLVGGKAKNIYTITKDTANYIFPENPVDGTGKFRRLTLDLGLGYEIPIGMSIYLYVEARAWIPTTDYPSKYLLVNDHAPFIGTANLGLRILFD